MEALYLNAIDQTTLEQSLIDAGVAHYVDQDNALVLSPVEGYSIDTIGFAEGYVGYMCNLLGEFTDEQKALLPIIPVPLSPIRIFGGWWVDPSLVVVEPIVDSSLIMDGTNGTNE